MSPQCELVYVLSCNLSCALPCLYPCTFIFRYSDSNHVLLFYLFIFFFNLWGPSLEINKLIIAMLHLKSNHNIKTSSYAFSLPPSLSLAHTYVHTTDSLMLLHITSIILSQSLLGLSWVCALPTHIVLFLELFIQWALYFNTKCIYRSDLESLIWV